MRQGTSLGDRHLPSRLRSGIEARLHPRLCRSCAPKLHPIMQPERPVVPEFHLYWNHAETRPIRRAWNIPNRVLGRIKRDSLLKSKAALQRPGLRTGPRSNAAATWAGGEIGVGLLWRYRRNQSAHAHLRRRLFQWKQSGLPDASNSRPLALSKFVKNTKPRSSRSD